MMKVKTLLLMALVLLTIGCKEQDRGQRIENLAQKKMEHIEKEGFQHIQKMIVNNLKEPESYEPISTDMSVVTTDMIIYDSDAFIALRGLERATREFNETYGNDSTSQEARAELHVMQAMKDVVFDRFKVIRKLPVEFEGIDVYHQFYANDRPNHKTKKGYHIIFHKDDRTTLLSDHDEFLRIQTFARELLKDTPYSSSYNPNINSQVGF